MERSIVFHRSGRNGRGEPKVFKKVKLSFSIIVLPAAGR